MEVIDVAESSMDHSVYLNTISLENAHYSYSTYALSVKEVNI